ncbi:MAG: K(+)-transporting ATPase subunit C [Leptolyngbyaceae cyanobacterium SU_3_3]|nr:K(+)-transporting ATPase subunit C [Leptolyngbyaceae cyanobacterium SU_3_3]
MSLVHEVIRAVRATLVLWVLVAVIYPVLILAVGQVAFPYQANGSLIKNDQGQVIGSTLIGQPFTSDLYFNSRPSTTHYSSVNPQNDTAGILETGTSGASNLAPSNPALLERIQGQAGSNPAMGDVAKLKQAGIQPTADLIYTSGSSLDPHITPEAARAQITRIAQARQRPSEQLEELIRQNTEGRSLGIFGEPGVNVLKLNAALDTVSR